MAKRDLDELLEKLSSLNDEQIKLLQSQVDLLERRGAAGETHHETTSHHHTSTLFDFGVRGLDRDVIQKKSGGAPG